MPIPSSEEIEARIARLEAQVRALKAAYQQVESEKKALLLAWQGQWERLRARLLALRTKIEGALSHGGPDADVDSVGAAADDPGAA